MIDRLHRIIEAWYLFENALFEVCLSHELRENYGISCPMRCGKGVIEYNPLLLSTFDDDVLELLLKRECIRIILKHPYERQPLDCPPLARFAASEIVIADHYPMRKLGMLLSMDYGLPPGKSYEWYAHRLKGMIIKGKPDPDGNYIILMTEETAADATGLWQEDDFRKESVNDALERVKQSKNWGTLPQSIVELVEADSRGRVDYRKILGGFRASVLSSKRSLTRMRQNRRTGFQNLGSTRKFSTRILVGVDVSSSVTKESLSLFLSVVNKAFRYGIEKLDVVTFDVELHDFLELSAAQSSIKVHGRGGTDFQAIINYAHSNGYDGLIILTDGEAPLPKMPQHPRFKIAWVFEDKQAYDIHAERFSALGRCFPIVSD